MYMLYHENKLQKKAKKRKHFKMKHKVFDKNFLT